MGGGGSTHPQRRVREPRVLPDRSRRSATERRHPAGDQPAVGSDRVRLDEPAAARSTPRWNRRPRSARSVPARRGRSRSAGQYGRARRGDRRRHSTSPPSTTMAHHVRDRVAGRSGRDRRHRTSTPCPGMAVPNLAIVRLGNAGDVNFLQQRRQRRPAGRCASATSATAHRWGCRRWPRLACSTPAMAPADHSVRRADRCSTCRWPVAVECRTNREAVALNVTVTGPTAGSYLTVWPSGRAATICARASTWLPARTGAEHGADAGRRERHGQHLQQRRLDRCHRRRARLL